MHVFPQLVMSVIVPVLYNSVEIVSFVRLHLCSSKRHSAKRVANFQYKMDIYIYIYSKIVCRRSGCLERRSAKAMQSQAMQTDQ